MPGHEVNYGVPQSKGLTPQKTLRIGFGIAGALALLLALSTISELPVDLEPVEVQVDTDISDDKQKLLQLASVPQADSSTLNPNICWCPMTVQAEEDGEEGIKGKIKKTLREKRLQVQHLIPQRALQNWWKLKQLVKLHGQRYLLMFNGSDSEDEEEDEKEGQHEGARTFLAVGDCPMTPQTTMHPSDETSPGDGVSPTGP
ncbi:hypothetical protein Efla_000353 [Eimeria flavescens]